MKQWPKVTINNDAGEEVEAVAPFLVTASRVTDVPSFFAPWFFNRLNTGHCARINPYNGHKQYVSFVNTRFIGFWSKYAEPALPYIDILDARKLNYYFQITINDYEKELYEKNIPPLQERIESFKRLSGRIGKEKVHWRFDPCILTDTLTVTDLLRRIKNIGDQLYPYTEQLTISFLSLYVKTIRQFKRIGMNIREVCLDDRMKIVQGIAEMNRAWGLQVKTCAEPLELAKYNVRHGACIDYNLITRLFSHDDKLMNFLNYSLQNNLFDESPQITIPKNLRDTGQRNSCLCIISKDVGSYNTCMNGCIYCYACNKINEPVKNGLIDSDSEILPAVICSE